MTDFNSIKNFLKHYSGKEISLMEVCGTHTSVIAKAGIHSMLSPKIKLVSGPGCPVCVTVSSYIDRLCFLAEQPDTTIVTFGDMMKVRGSVKSLLDVTAEGGSVKMVYSPFDVLALCEKEPDRLFVFAAIGFETTSPVYALLLQKALDNNIKNLKLLNSLKTMPEAVEWVCEHNSMLDGFIAPGHVCAVTGSDIFLPLAEKYKMPFVVSGFTPEHILCAVYLLIKKREQGKVFNLYTSTVRKEPNETARLLCERFFRKDSAGWRGLGAIADSGLYIKDDYKEFDAGSSFLLEDAQKNKVCRCPEVITGAISPKECTLLGKLCTPENPQGACMVSEEGSCHSAYLYEQP